MCMAEIFGISIFPKYFSVYFLDTRFFLFRGVWTSKKILGDLILRFFHHQNSFDKKTARFFKVAQKNLTWRKNSPPDFLSMRIYADSTIYAKSKLNKEQDITYKTKLINLSMVP